MKRKVYTFGLFCLLSFIVFYVTPCMASVTGTVKDTSGRPVSGVLVTFTDESYTENKNSAYTDVDGTYSITITPVTVKEATPVNFQLYQNYPNPFNPSTTILYSLEKADFVTLSIFNITGQKVRTLVNDYQSAGLHKITWDGLNDNSKSVAAGIYIYQLNCSDIVESQKMLLIDGGSNGRFSGSNNIVSPANIMAKPVYNIWNTTYLLTITGDDIKPYIESGITVIDGNTYDFVVEKRTVFENHVITFVSIPGGTFQMGDAVGDLNSSCRPVHTVTVSGFEMSKTEITNAQYASYLNEALASGDIEIKDGDVYDKTGEWLNRYLDIGYGDISNNKCWISYSNGTFTVTPGKDNWPVVAVTWYGAKAFALYYGLNLPTEAEWEYAARGGNQYKYGSDDGTISNSKTNYSGTIGYPTDVGSYPANPFGLYDMSGNVWEYCNDWYDNYSSESITNPSGPQYGSNRVLRGGSWKDTAENNRTAFRSFTIPSYRYTNIGFRVVRR